MIDISFQTSTKTTVFWKKGFAYISTIKNMSWPFTVWELWLLSWQVLTNISTSVLQMKPHLPKDLYSNNLFHCIIFTKTHTTFNDDIHKLYSSPDRWMITSRMLRWAEHAEWIWKVRYAYKVFIQDLQREETTLDY